MDEVLAAARESPEERPLEVRVWLRVMARLSGSTGSVKRVRFLDGDGADQTVEIELGPNPGSPVRFGNFPTFFNRFHSRRVTSDGVKVGVIWFNNWMVPAIAQVDRAVDEFRELDGIVVDLRGNTGGLGAMVMGVAGHFYEVRTPLGTMKTRQNDLEFFANPRLSDRAGNSVRPFAGAVAILTDEITASASEMLAGGMQTTGRVRVFGETTMGAVLPAVTDLLPSGDVLYHALGEFTTAKGESLEGVGVVPDERVPLNRDDLLAGRDLPLAAALRWIEEQSHGGSNPAGEKR
jgi:carboxyl-terminal processing protease